MYSVNGFYAKLYSKKQVPLSKCSYFSDWKQEEGDWSFEPAAEFISEQFEDQNDGEPVCALSIVLTYCRMSFYYILCFAVDAECELCHSDQCLLW